jgi:hypothetical protein
MRLIVSGATKDVALHPSCGILVTPQGGNSIERVASSGRMWAADNSAFGAWDQEKFWRMITRINAVDCSRLMWVACPDVVANAQETINRFYEWQPQLEFLGLPIAFVGQDGLSEISGQIPWENFVAFFVGGSTAWKIGPEAAEFCREAKARRKLVHVGRVNTKRRIKHCLELDADTIDGTGFSRWPKRIPMGLKWIQHQKRQPVMF